MKSLRDQEKMNFSCRDGMFCACVKYVRLLWCGRDERIQYAISDWTDGRQEEWWRMDGRTDYFPYSLRTMCGFFNSTQIIRNPEIFFNPVWTNSKLFVNTIQRIFECTASVMLSNCRVVSGACIKSYDTSLKKIPNDQEPAQQQVPVYICSVEGRLA